MDLMGWTHAAERATGLFDWGDDHSFLEGLDVMLSAVADSSVAPVQRQRFERQALDYLATRLHLVDDQVAHPEVTEFRIEAPIVITGLPRTGSSLLQALLASVEGARAPHTWQVLAPWPAPRADDAVTDPRVAAVQAGLDVMLKRTPALRRMHPFGATFPAECNDFLTLHFTSANFWVLYGVPRYVDWLASATCSGLYLTHKRILQQLQWHAGPTRWVLKSAQHLLCLEDLLEAYPDALVVHLHRDPDRAIDSISRLAYTTAAARDSRADPSYFLRSAAELWGQALRRALSSRRDRMVEARIVDVGYAELLADPIGTVCRIQERLGLALSGEDAAELRRTVDHYARWRPARRVCEPASPTLGDPFPEYRERFGHLLREP
jgi:LPS sulfotransferase NodH